MKNLLFSLFFWGPMFIYSQDGTRGPHKGALASTGDYKIEALGCSEYLEIYVYDKFMEPMLNFGIVGDVVYYKGKEAGTTAKLVNYGNDEFTAKYPEYYFTDFKITIKIKDVTYSARFKNECIIPN